MPSRPESARGAATWRVRWARLGIPADVATRALSRLHPEARRLVCIGRAADDGRILRLTPAAAHAWRRMQTAATDDGVTLIPLSAYRSVARQTLIIRHKLAAGQSIDAILRVSAIPGCSEHHTGRALDLGAPGHLGLVVSFARTKEFRWMRRNGANFGFHLTYPRNNRQGINYEPWHWCWRPVQALAPK
ncbi:D-alanyl-D-alanine carboxypeptidase [Lacunisphaera limnophila]|uniref:D-alanyl-D-alanine carboxypeptidase n=1 Tax=Lacunisphaera limnophila TaxID=1838286 RepID=A0A1D8AV04_9BACT|nr:M15 family metallopeptidase [Lacunisphaera limnophila]AOS44695.1 D-alanyl-D-alanine carboxypeptidase [Lacunisphaera limnophila]